MASKIKIDGIDKIIIKRLVEDARTPILSIAREVGISGAAIHQRLRKLESSDLMAGSKLILNPKALGYTTTAFVGIFLDSAAMYSLQLFVMTLVWTTAILSPPMMEPL